MKSILHTTDTSKIFTDVWKMLDTLMKTLKTMPTGACGFQIKQKMWENVMKYVTVLQGLEESFQPGAFYKWEDKPDYLIFRLEAFYFDDDNTNYPLKLDARVLTSTKKEFHYQKAQDKMLLDIHSFYNNCDSFELKKEELPLYIGNAFNGSLLRELLAECEETEEVTDAITKLDAPKESEENNV